MTFLIFLLVNFNTTFQDNYILPGSDGLVCLKDAYTFGISGDEARINSSGCWDRMMRWNDEIQTYNKPEISYYWREESVWRARCWEYLNIALNGCRPILYELPSDENEEGINKNKLIMLENRIDALMNLRMELGDEAFFAGRMPAPFPNLIVSPSCLGLPFNPIERKK